MNTRLRVFAGPNGSGKSSLYSYLCDQNFFHPYYYINADQIYKELTTTGFSLANWPITIDKDSIISYFSESTFSALLDVSCLIDGLHVEGNYLLWDASEEHITYVCAAMADYLRSRMLHAPSSFACETVFSHESKLAFLSDARANGFKIYLYFISTEKPLINIDRVEVRTELGGHSVPREKIESRYWRTMENLLPAILLADKSFLFDNSESRATGVFDNFAEVTDGEISLIGDTVPHWFERHVLSKIQS